MLDAFHALQEFAVLAGYPPDPKTRQSVGLGHHAQRQTQFIYVRDLWERYLRSSFNEPKHLIAEDVDAALSRHPNQRVQSAMRNDLPRRVVRKADRDYASVRADRVANLIQIQVPIPICMQRNTGRIANAKRNRFR